jgi:hypothetical protein
VLIHHFVKGLRTSLRGRSRVISSSFTCSRRSGIRHRQVGRSGGRQVEHAGPELDTSAEVKRSPNAKAANLKRRRANARRTALQGEHG